MRKSDTSHEAIVKDVEIQERASRVNDLLKSEVWHKDILPMLTELYDSLLNEVISGTKHPDALRGFDTLITTLDHSVRLGHQALERLVARRMKASQDASREEYLKSWTQQD